MKLGILYSYRDSVHYLEILHYYEKLFYQMGKLVKANAPQIKLNYLFVMMLVVINIYYDILILNNLTEETSIFFVFHTSFPTIVDIVLTMWFTFNLNGLQMLVS